MPPIDPTHLQQVLQMSSAVEKVQMQQVQHLASDQIQDQERDFLDEMKRTEIQDPEESNPTEPTHPDGGQRRRRLRIKKTGSSAEKKEQGGAPQAPGESIQGNHLDIVV